MLVTTPVIALHCVAVGYGREDLAKAAPSCKALDES